MPIETSVGINPKDFIGRSKIDLTAFPEVGVIHGAHAMMFGQDIYDPYNWRCNSIKASIYIAACRRHLASWMAGEEYASDSGAHHLGHAESCLAILLDAAEHGNLCDDRPSVASGLVTAHLLSRLSESWQAIGRPNAAARRQALAAERSGAYEPTIPKTF